MGIDHSLTYTGKSLKNLPHRKRLQKIFSILERENIEKSAHTKYADIGCSNGFVTKLISDKLAIEHVAGFDHEPTNLELAKKRYPDFDFAPVDLNAPAEVGQYDLVTCFETLEHVGNMEVALDNLLAATRSGGILLLSVPVEIGPWGIVKFLVKTLGYGYSLDELSKDKIYAKYLLSLLAKKDVGKFRGKSEGWGTHFGFDYRAVDRQLRDKAITYRAANHFATRFYVVRR